MTSKPNQPPSRTRGRDQMGMGINNNTSTYSTLRSRARVKDRFYDPAIASDVDVIAAEIAGIPMRTFYRILEKNSK